MNPSLSSLHFIGQAQFREGVGGIGAGHPAGDDAPGAGATDLVEVGSLGQGPGLVLGRQQAHVGLTGHRRHHHLVEGVLIKPARPRPGRQFSQGHGAPGMVHPGGGAQQHRDLELLGEGEGRQGHGFRFLGGGRLQHGQSRQLGVITIVLLVLTGEQGRIVGADNHHAPLDPHVGQGHEGVGGHIEAHVFHGAQHPPAAGRGPCRHLQGHLFVGGKFELEVGLPGNPITPVADFRGGSPGVGGHQGHPGFQGAPDNGLIPQEEPPLSCRSGQKL